MAGGPADTEGRHRPTESPGAGCTGGYAGAGVANEIDRHFLIAGRLNSPVLRLRPRAGPKPRIREPIATATSGCPPQVRGSGNGGSSLHGLATNNPQLPGRSSPATIFSRASQASSAPPPGGPPAPAAQGRPRPPRRAGSPADYTTSRARRSTRAGLQPHDAHPTLTRVFHPRATR